MRTLAKSWPAEPSLAARPPGRDGDRAVALPQR
jgi:hypothetical protein